jgi:hypothetical protein
VIAPAVARPHRLVRMEVLEEHAFRRARDPWEEFLQAPAPRRSDRGETVAMARRQHAEVNRGKPVTQQRVRRGPSRSRLGHRSGWWTSLAYPPP